jgi:hypothetical protein
VALARESQTGRVPLGLSANLSANLNATGDLGLFIPSYVFATPFLGGQASVSAVGIYGLASTSLAGTLSGTLTTPLGALSFMRSDSISDSVTGFGDVLPMFALRWRGR